MKLASLQCHDNPKKVNTYSRIKNPSILSINNILHVFSVILESLNIVSLISQNKVGMYNFFLNILNIIILRNKKNVIIC